jgi:hypothetical protein
METACGPYGVPLAAAVLDAIGVSRLDRCRRVAAGADHADPSAGRRGDSRRALVEAGAGHSPTARYGPKQGLPQRRGTPAAA